MPQGLQAFSSSLRLILFVIYMYVSFILLYVSFIYVSYVLDLYT